MNTHLIYIIIILVLIIIAGYFYIKSVTRARRQTEHEHTIIQYELKNVFKIVLIESFHCDIQTFKNSKELMFGSSEKKAAIIVRANVQVGFDLTGFKLPVVDKENKKIIFEYAPEPKILSIDHELQWYNITPGWFNKFTAEDFTEIGKKGKERIRDAVHSSTLLNRVENKFHEMIMELENKTHWQVVIKSEDKTNKIDSYEKQIRN